MVKALRGTMLFSVALAAAVLLPGPVAASEPAFRKPGERDKCPVCGMFVAKYPDWTAEVVYADGAYAVFDGPKDLFKYLLDAKQYAPGRSGGDSAGIFVSDYYSLQPVNGRSAFYVVGSDILGPMGRELIPFGREADAREFLKDHRGRKVLRFEEITAEVVRTLD